MSRFPAIGGAPQEQQDPLELLGSYLPVDGSEPMTGELQMKANDIFMEGGSIYSEGEKESRGVLSLSSTTFTLEFALSQPFNVTSANTLVKNALRLYPADSAVTIATGSIPGSRSYIVVDTEGAAASDDLDTITNPYTGKIVVLRAADSARSVVVKNGTDNIILAGSDCTLDNADDTLTLIGNGTAWLELCRSNNGA